MQSEPIFLTGSLAVFKYRGEAAQNFLGASPRPAAAGRNASELFSEYRTRQEIASFRQSPRFAWRPNHKEFWLKI